MNKLNKNIGLLFCGIVFAVLGQQAQAATGICTPISGAPMRYSFTFSPTLDSPEKNVTGTIISNASEDKWSLSNSYNLKCDCVFANESYITAYSPLPALGMQTSEGGEYYKLNEYLAIAAKVYVVSNDMVPVPFTNVSNKLTNLKYPCASIPYESGSRGSIDLYFIRPFIGVTTIPTTKLVEVHIATVDGAVSPEAASEVYMSGTVTVPQSCEIGPDPVTVDFGDIFTTAFKTAGAKPEGVEIINKVLTLDCRNISDGVVVSLSFQGSPDPTFNDALQTNNSDIAVRIVDKNNNIIAPNSGLLGVDFDVPSNKGTTEMNLYPISTSGKTPALGEFSAEAIIRAEIN